MLKMWEGRLFGVEPRAEQTVQIHFDLSSSDTEPGFLNLPVKKW